MYLSFGSSNFLFYSQMKMMSSLLLGLLWHVQTGFMSEDTFGPSSCRQFFAFYVMLICLQV